MELLTPVLGPTQPRIQCVLRVISSSFKKPGREVNYSLAYSSDSKNQWSCTSASPLFFNGVNGDNSA